MTQADFLKVIGDSLTVTKTLGARMLSPQTLWLNFYSVFPRLFCALISLLADCREPYRLSYRL